MNIEVKNLVKTYGEQQAVNNISFQVNKGEIVGFLGPNGAGKSTTMKIITGYLRPTSGSVLVNNHSVMAHPMESKKRIGYLPESNALYYDMYVKEYLFFLAGIHQLENRKKRVGEVIEMVGLGVEAHKRIGQLSKGYKQRVGIAGALIHNPDILILDEPTSGLDPNQIVEIREVIRKWGTDKVVLFSTHILQEVEAICNRVIIINKGTIVANESLANLHKQNEREQLKIYFAQPVLRSRLETLKAATEAMEIENNGWLLSTSNLEGLRKEVMEMGLSEGISITSMQQEKKGLEEIFKSLTT